MSAHMLSWNSYVVFFFLSLSLFFSYVSLSTQLVIPTKNLESTQIDELIQAIYLSFLNLISSSLQWERFCFTELLWRFHVPSVLGTWQESNTYWFLIILMSSLLSLSSLHHLLPNHLLKDASFYILIKQMGITMGRWKWGLILHG